MTTSATSSRVVLAAEHVEKQFDDARGATPALKDISFEAQAGRVTGLVGADGAGKTTLLRCAAGLLLPTGGQLRVLDMDPARDLPRIQSRIGYMPQRFGLYQELTVMENLALYADLQGVPRGERRARFDELLAMTGLEAFGDRRAGALSGGMKQKLGLACALVKRPDLLLLDEPTVGVDPVSRRELWRIVYRLVEENDLGVLLSTAYLDEAEACHNIILLHDGEKRAEGVPSDFHARLEGRVHTISPHDDESPRRIQAELMAESDVVDASIRNGCVRVVMPAGEPGRGTARAVLPERYRDRAQTTAPRFEDAFMDLVPSSGTYRPATTEDPDAPRNGNRDDILVRADKLMKRFGDFVAVRDISFEVPRGEVFGILGPNGAGKTTTFRMLCGLLTIGGGRAEVAGRDLRHSRARARQRLGYMAQTFSLYAELSVLENFRFYGRAYGLRRRRLKERMEWALHDFGLEPWKEAPAGRLPGGYKQRLAMATALLHEPDLLFLDEPTSGVDPLARREFWIRIGRFARSGVTVVVTTHFMEEAEYCDRLLIMAKGEELALGTPAEIRNLARDETHSDPSIEDAFVALAQGDVVPEEKRNREGSDSS